MKNEIKLTLAAEDFSKCYGIVILENGDYMINVDQSKIPSAFLNRLKKWYKEYYPYTGMSLKELESKREQTEKLDDVGIELLNEIYKNGMFKYLNIDRYIYCSRGIDKPIVELN